jgi:hypothetical protein
VNRSEVEQLLEEYRAGLEAELVILRQLSVLASRQKCSTESRDFERLSAESDDRDRVTRQLVELEDGLAGLRHRLASVRAQASSLPGYQTIVDLRREAADLVSKVLSVDQESLKSLSDSETARRAALASLEKGETTLAAYRKVLTPPVEHAAIVDRVG